MSSALDVKLRRLRLAWMAQGFEAQNTESIKAKQSYLEFLRCLVDGELEARDNKSLMKRVKAARFPLAKTLEEFNFDFQPKLDVKLVKTLASCDFVERRENVIFVGLARHGEDASGDRARAQGVRARDRSRARTPRRDVSSRSRPSPGRSRVVRLAPALLGS